MQRSIDEERRLRGKRRFEEERRPGTASVQDSTLQSMSVFQDLPGRMPIQVEEDVLMRVSHPSYFSIYDSLAFHPYRWSHI